MFNEQFTILIRDINYGQHLDHLSLLGYLQETRIRYLRNIGYSENDVDGHGSRLIISNLTCDYKKECFYGDIINVQLDLSKISELRLLFIYKVTKENKIIATAEITGVFINFKQNLIKVPSHLNFG